MTSAWALLVVSSEKQSETVPHQRAWADETANAKGWVIDRAGDFEGVSTGKDRARKIVLKMLAELRALELEQRPAWLMMIRLDRLGRDGLECQVVLSEIHDLGVKVWTRDGGEELGDTAMQRLVSAVKLFGAEQDNEVRRDKIAAVYRRRRAAGVPLGNRRPYGLIRTSDGGTAVVEDQAAAVRRAFELRLTGLGYLAIARRLMDTAAPRRRKDGSEVPIHWGQVPVKRLLRTEAYIGTIVDEMTFHRAQIVAADLGARYRNLTTPVRRWPLTGALRCYCGRTMRGSTGGRLKSGDRIRHYRCSGRTWNHGDTPFSLRAERAEEQFEALLDSLVADPDLVHRRANELSPSPALLDRALRELRGEIAGLDRLRQSAWDLHAAGKIRGELVEVRIDELAAQRTEFEARVAELERQRVRAMAVEHEEQLATQTIRRAQRAWRSPAATIEAQRTVAMAVARFVGGLYIDIEGRLKMGRPPDASEQADSRWRRGGAF